MVTQLRFARTEFMRCLEGVFAEDASRRLLPMNCISWIVGHLAYQEHLYWVVRAQGRDLAPDLEHQVGWGQTCEYAAFGWDVGHLAHRYRCC
ncbi:MAG TPA: hypothetical protein QF571_09630 [Desulfobacterales bacterium]|nr:hypothetical protein [Desulfobacterales bacterium]